VSLVAPVVLFIAIVLFLLPVLKRLVRVCHLTDITPEWLENFTPVTYRPMADLLAEEDFNFLLRQPGFETSISRKLRRDRIQIFRLYLNRLIADFNRLHVYARFRLSQSSEDNSALLLRLIWLRVRFSLAVMRLEFSLVLAYFGFQPRLVEKAIACLEEMNTRLCSIPAV
jgi:hypothetical protein